MEDFVEKKFLARRTCTLSQTLKVKDERLATVKKVREVAAILQKPEFSRTQEECDIISSCSDIVKEVHSRQAKRDRDKARLEEIEDTPDLLEEKCIRLAAALSRANSLTVYTGAGISTAASIPDYRGTNGVWTRLQQGKDIGNHDLSQAEPTITHMALYALYKSKVLKHIVSQNCDGLHLRSGIPKSLLSEVHGNMNVEVCRSCKPSREYWRLFDVTEKTARYSHGTGRTCHVCNSVLQDSIVHFGERGSLSWPINWNGASKAAKQADIILCLGSSLKVLKRYPWLWQMDRPVSKRAKLYIVNLQWTPKDENAVLKINGKCDQVMKIVMSHLGIEIPKYNRSKDPIFHHAIRLANSEQSTTSQPLLEMPNEYQEYTDIENLEIESDMQDNSEKTITSEIECKEEKLTTNISNESQVSTNEPITAYPAPLFTALPFISMGLPFPPLYLYQSLAQLMYYPALQPSLQASESAFKKPERECDFCLDNEGSIACLYYRKNDIIDCKVTEEDTVNEKSSLEDDKTDTDENIPVVTAKNPGWFGKGYRKGKKRKR